MHYRREIDGLRALAVLPVILFHAGFQVFSGGFIGVDVFFVISGYLITTIICADLEVGQFSIINFYERRARRVLPALFLVMLCCLPFAWFWLPPLDMKGFSESLIAVSVFASNILFWRTGGYFDTAADLKPLLHTWSLAVEEQYYLLFPIFLILTWRLGKFWVLSLLSAAFLVSLAAAQWGSANSSIAAFYLLPTRGWELLIGAFASFYLSKRNHSNLPAHLNEIGGILGVVLIAYAVFTFNENLPYPSLYTVVPTLGAALIILCATEFTFAGKILGSRLLVGIGLISYSAYLWHQPMFVFARHKMIGEPSKNLFAILALLSLALAYISWRYVEVPFRKKSPITRKQVFCMLFVGVFVFCSIGTVGYMTKGFRGRALAQNLRQLDYDMDDLGYKKCNQPELVNGESINYCYETAKGEVNAAIIGDSHADDKFYGIEKNDSERNWALIGNTSCPPLLGVNVEADVKGCLKKSQKIFDYITKQEQIKTVALSFSHGYALTTNYAADHIRLKIDRSKTKITSAEILAPPSELIYYGLSRAIQKLLQAHKNVYVFIDIPELPYFPAECLRGRPHCEAPVEEVEARLKEHRASLARLKAAFPAIKIFDPTDIFCDQKTCTYTNAGIVLYRDSHHLTLEGSDYYGKVFLQWASEQTVSDRK